MLGNKGNVWRSFALVNINIQGFASGVTAYQRLELESRRERTIYMFINLKSDIYDAQSFVEHGWQYLSL